MISVQWLAPVSSSSAESRDIELACSQWNTDVLHPLVLCYYAWDKNPNCEEKGEAVSGAWHDCPWIQRNADS